VCAADAHSTGWRGEPRAPPHQHQQLVDSGWSGRRPAAGGVADAHSAGWQSERRAQEQLVVDNGWQSQRSPAASAPAKRARPADGGAPAASAKRRSLPAPPAQKQVDLVPALGAQAGAAASAPAPASASAGAVDEKQLEPEQLKRLKQQEKGSKGIGLKLLLGMGFKGKLGRTGRAGHAGLDKPIEVEMRTGTRGLGSDGKKKRKVGSGRVLAE